MILASSSSNRSIFKDENGAGCGLTDQFTELPGQFVGQGAVVAGGDVENLAVLHAQEEMVGFGEVGVGGVDKRDILDTGDRNPNPVIHEKAFPTIQENGALGVVRPGRVDDNQAIGLAQCRDGFLCRRRGGILFLPGQDDEAADAEDQDEDAQQEKRHLFHNHQFCSRYEIFCYFCKKTGGMMRRTMFYILLACLAGGIQARAQEPETDGNPTAGSYLMPAFAQGMVYFSDRAPAQGLLNICAVDNTLRFMDKGQELAAADISHVTKVVIEGITFIHDNGFFYRIYPVTPEAGLASRREIRVMDDGKPGAFGMKDRTSAIRDYGTIYGDGGSYDLKKDRKYPQEVHEIIFLYRGNDILNFNKRNLRKIFPQKKEEIDRYFQEGHPVPDQVDAALELLETWAE